MNTVNPPRFFPSLAVRLCGLALLLPAVLPAQTTPATTETDDEIVQLSPFEVSSGTDVGYLANDTLAGSRMRTKLTDVPNAITVFTPEFMQDILAVDEADLMRYSSSAVEELTDQTPGVQGISLFEGYFRSRIRGQVATRSRNYFESNLLPDTFNSERFEEARGPNAILFGLGGSGGLLNTSTKRVNLNRDFTHLELTVGSWSQFRGTLDHNLAVNKMFGLRVNAVLEDAEGWHPDDTKQNERYHASFTFKPWTNTTIRAEYEFGNLTNSVTRSQTPRDLVSVWANNGRGTVANPTQVATTAAQALGFGRFNADPRITYVANDGVTRNFQQTAMTNHTTATGFNRSALLPDVWYQFEDDAYPRNASFFGPGGVVHNDQEAWSVFVETQPVENLFLELAFAHDQREHEIFDSNINVMDVRGEVTQTFRDGSNNPYTGLYYIETFPIRRAALVESDRLRATAAYTFDFGRAGRHNLAGLWSRDESDNPRQTDFLVVEGAPFNANPSHVRNRIWTRTYITDPGDAAQWAVPDWRDVPATVTVTNDTGAASGKTYNTVWTPTAVNRPISDIDSAMASLQSYWVDDRVITTLGWRYIDYAQTRGTEIAEGNFDRISYGLVAKATPQISAYYNYSENAVVPTSVQTLIPDESVFPLNIGEGEDYGFMFNLFNGRAFTRVGYFKSSSIDQAKAVGVGGEIRNRHERITDALVGAGLLNAANVIPVEGGDFDLADVETKGIELNFTANLTTSWRLMINATLSESVDSALLKVGDAVLADVLPQWQTAGGANVVTSNGSTITEEIAAVSAWRDGFKALEGDSTIGHRETELRLFTRYEFKGGRLDGLFLGGGLTHGSAPVIGKNTATNTFIKGDAHTEADLLLGYRFRLPESLGGANTVLQLNAQNLLQEDDFRIVRADPDGQLFRGVIYAPRRVAFSVRVNF